MRYSYRRNGRCSNGSSPVGDESDYVIPPARISAKGNFSISVTEPDGDSLHITGKVTGPQGNWNVPLQVQRRFSDL